MKKTFCLLAMLAIISIFITPAGFSMSDKGYMIQPGDVLQITVHEQPDLDTKTRVTTDGYISFPLLGNVKLEGLTVQEAEKRLKDLLQKDYLVNPQVVVFIEEYHPKQVSVIGAVNQPGKYDMNPEKSTTLLAAIAMAGGFTEDANRNGTRVIRVENGEKKTINVRVKDITDKGQKEKDIDLKPDDIVFVPESYF